MEAWFGSVLPDLAICSKLGYFLSEIVTKIGFGYLAILATFEIQQKTLFKQVLKNALGFGQILVLGHLYPIVLN